jgi:hypothetical protein
VLVVIFGLLKSSKKNKIIDVIKIKTKNNFLFIIKFLFKSFTLLTFFSIFFISYLYSESIGIIENIEGEFLYQDQDGNPQSFEELDEIYLETSYQLLEGNAVTVSLLDGTFITFEDKTEFRFLEFQNIDQARPILSFEVPTGVFTIETGDIPKRKKDSSNIVTPVGKLILNGTLVSGSLTSEQNDIFLLTDSFGNTGELVVDNGSGEIQSVSPNQGLRVTEQGSESLEVSEELQSRIDNNADKIVNAAIVDDAKIDLIIEKKIQSGKLSDINGDGIVNEEDAIQFKANIINDKNTKIDKIINNTSTNSSLLSKVIANSPDQNSSGILEKVLLSKPEITATVVDTLVNENANKLTNIAQINSATMESVLVAVVTNNTSTDNQLSNILAKVDQNIASNLIDKVVDSKPELLTSVVTKMSAADPLKLNQIVGQNEELNNKVTSKIVEQVTLNANGKDQLKGLLTGLDASITSRLITEVNQINPEIANGAIKDLVSENPQKMSQILENNISSSDESITQLIIKESIAAGQQDIIAEVAAKVQTDNPELLNVISESVQENTQDLIDEGLIDEDSLAQQDDLLAEVLASPN